MGAALLLSAPPAEAVPSFARQTGLACEACHTVFPELTAFGRRFKLNGYVLTTRQSVSDIDVSKQSTLSLADLPPLSAMLQAGVTVWNKAPADSGSPGTTAQNGNVQFPAQLALFYGGKISDNMGSLFQVTLSQTNSNTSFTIDNSDIRYANHSADNDWVYGVTVNNAPSVQDVWNSTPTWAGGALAMSPSVGGPGSVVTASPLINTLQSHNVAGLGAYTFYKDSLYAEVSAYRTAQQGISTAVDSTVSGVISDAAPYWRLAYEQQWGKHNLEVGTFGMWAQYQPNKGAVISPKQANTYTDAALDAQYQYLDDDHMVTVLGSFLREDYRVNANNAASYANRNNALNKAQLTATYYYQRKFGGSVNFTKLTGRADPTFYPISSTATSSSNGSPNSQYEVFELDYMPWLNTKLLLQYTWYNQVNGVTGRGAPSTTGGGDTGRGVSDNNTVMVGLWTAF